jgi:hypothetical protein
MGMTRIPGVPRSAGMLAMAASAAASCSGWGLDTSRARIAASTVTFIPGMTASPPSVARAPLGKRPRAGRAGQERGLDGGLTGKGEISCGNARRLGAAQAAAGEEPQWANDGTRP